MEKRTATMHPLDDEKTVELLLKQAKNEPPDEYRKRLLKAATGTDDPLKQERRYAVIERVRLLAEALAKMDSVEDADFIERTYNDIDAIAGSIGTKPNTHGISLRFARQL